MSETSTPQLDGKIAAPRLKYRAALGDFRRALMLDPANAKAKENAAFIEGIYKSMGRPVPQV